MAGVWEYQMTNGLGIIEYMGWCDDMNLEPSMFSQLRTLLSKSEDSG